MTKEKNLDVIVKNVKVDWFTNTFKALMGQDYHRGGVQVTKSKFPIDQIYNCLLTIITSQEIIQNIMDSQIVDGKPVIVDGKPVFLSEYKEAKDASEKVDAKYKADSLLYKSYENAKKNAADRSLKPNKRKEAQKTLHSAKEKLEKKCVVATKEAFDKWFKPKADKIKEASDIYKELESEIGGAFAPEETYKSRIASEHEMIAWQKSQIELYAHFDVDEAVEKMKAGAGKKTLFKQITVKPNDVYDFRHSSGTGPGHYMLVLHPAEGSTRRLQFLNYRSKEFDNRAPLKEEKNLVHKITEQLRESKVLIE